MATSQKDIRPSESKWHSSERPSRESATEAITVHSGEATVERLDLFDDGYAQTILQTLSLAPACGRELADKCDFSRATIYRRLSRLENAGLVRSEITLDVDGNHCKEFQLVRDELVLTVSDGTIKLTVRQSG